MSGYTEFLKFEEVEKERFDVLSPQIVVREERSLEEIFPNGIPRVRDKGKLGALEKKVIAAHVAGFSNVEIARMMGYDDKHISTILTHPDSKALIGEAAQDILKQTVVTVQAEMRARSHDALKTVLNLMDHAKHERIRLDAARDVLKGAGVFDNREGEDSTPISTEAASIIADVMRELKEDVVEFAPIGNSADVELLKAAASDAEVIEEMTNGNPTAR